MSHSRHGGGAPGQMFWMMAFMMAMCAAVPLTFLLMDAIGAPVLLTLVAVGAALALCLFGHRFMRH